MLQNPESDDDLLPSLAASLFQQEVLAGVALAGLMVLLHT
tara:strand:- start:291 stop:410 length:120 start_codon:yes stop_codon:yes gene_type:complete